MASIELDTFEELEELLRNWKSFKDCHVYDINGIVALMAACMDNISTHLMDSELEDISSCFTDAQKAFLRELSRAM